MSQSVDPDFYWWWIAGFPMVGLGRWFPIGEGFQGFPLFGGREEFSIGGGFQSFSLFGGGEWDKGFFY